MSRSPAYSAAIHKSFLDALSVGMTCKEAAHFAGLAWPTWCEWKRRILAGDRFHSGIAKLVDEHEQAIARGTAANLATLRKHAEKDSRAAIFLTQRRDDLPERKLRREKARAETALIKARTEAISGLSSALQGATDEELATVAAILERARRRGGPTSSNQERASAADESDGSDPSAS